MIHFENGDIVVAGMPELNDEYLCRVERVDPRGCGVNPILRPLRILRYPRQRAIMQDVPNENAPCRERELCRMKVLRPASENEKRRYPDWEASLRDCIRIRMLTSPRDERAILERHLAGDIKSHRATLTYREYEIRSKP